MHTNAWEKNEILKLKFRNEFSQKNMRRSSSADNISIFKQTIRNKPNTQCNKKTRFSESRQNLFTSHTHTHTVPHTSHTRSRSNSAAGIRRQRDSFGYIKADEDAILKDIQELNIVDEAHALVMLEEANKICEKLSLPTTYRAKRKKDLTLVCQICDNNIVLKEIPYQLFVSREYPRLTQRFNLMISRKKQNAKNTGTQSTAKSDLEALVISTTELTNKMMAQLDALKFQRL